MIGRRVFTNLLGGAAAAWPLRALAQKKIDRVGVLLLDNAGAALSAFFLGMLRDELRKAGYVEQQNVLFDIVSAEGKIDQLPKLAATLVALKVDLIVAVLTPSAHAARRRPARFPSSHTQATRSEPVWLPALRAPVGTSPACPQ